MSESRGDSRFTSFLLGFLVGAILAGLISTGLGVFHEYRLQMQARQMQEEAIMARMHAEMVIAEAEQLRKLAEANRAREAGAKEK